MIKQMIGKVAKELLMFPLNLFINSGVKNSIFKCLRDFIVNYSLFNKRATRLVKLEYDNTTVEQMSGV